MRLTDCWWLGACLVLAGCDEGELLPEGEFVLTQGQETDTWTAAPAPVRTAVTRVLEDEQRESFLELDAPVTRFSMGGDGVAAFEVAGFDADDQRQVWGRSFPVDTSTLYGYVVPLFVGRTGQFSRPPGNLWLDHSAHPPVAQLGARWILTTGESQTGYVETQSYDLALWTSQYAPELRCPDDTAPCTVRTLAVVDFAIIVALGDDFLRSYVYSTNDSGSLVVTPSDAGLPDGLNEWSEVAGGAVVEAPDGDVYVVGATRSDVPTTAVLRMTPGDSDTSAVVLRLTPLQTARAGAAATWVAGRGLVVAGGSAEGAGVELLAEGETEFVALPYPADPTTGAGLAALDAGAVLRIGGRDATDQLAQTVSLGLTCDADCAAERVATPVALNRAQAFSLDDGSVLTVGLGPDDRTHGARYAAGTIESIYLKDPRRGGSALRVSTGHIAVVGGVNDAGDPVSSVELFSP